jgi:hypothetical protein
MMNFIRKSEEIFQFILKDKIFDDADDLYTSKLKDFIDSLEFKTLCFTKTALTNFSFKPIRKLHNQKETFKINRINQWKLEKLYKAMIMNVVNYHRTPKIEFNIKLFMLMINKTANENYVDNSQIRFNSKGCISLPDKLCPIDYSDVDKQWSENPPNIVFC